MNSPFISVLFFTLILFQCTVVNAQLAQNLLIGNAKALALGNAVTADPPGVDSVHFNPAGLTRLKGRQTQLKFVAAEVGIEGEFRSNPEYDQLLAEYPLLGDDPLANSKSEVDEFAVYVPFKGVTEIPVLAGLLGGISYQPPDSSLTFATAVYAPLAGGWSRADDDPGRYYVQKVGLTRITFFSPSIGWKYSDKLSLGFGLGFSYMGAGAESPFRAASTIVGAVANLAEGEKLKPEAERFFIDLTQGRLSPFETALTLRVDVQKKFSTSANFGVLWQPLPWLSLGMLYQPEVRDRLKGDVSIEVAPSVLEWIDGFDGESKALLKYLELESGTIATTGHIDLTIPQHFALGASVQVTPRLKCNIDWKWVELSSWDTLHFFTDEPHPALQLVELIGITGFQSDGLIVPRGYKNASNFAFGVEYQLADPLAIRLGYEPRDQGIPADKADFLVPITDFDLWGVGFNYTPDAHSSYDLTVGYFNSSSFVKAGTSTNGNDTRPDNIVLNPTAGLDTQMSTHSVLIELTYNTRY